MNRGNNRLALKSVFLPVIQKLVKSVSQSQLVSSDYTNNFCRVSKRKKRKKKKYRAL